MSKIDYWKDCIAPDENMRELVQEYAAMQRERVEDEL
jgi:hypothetical protein